MKIVYQNVVVLLFFVFYNYLDCIAEDESDISVTIGAFFDEENKQSELLFKSMVQSNNLINKNFQYKMIIKTNLTTDSYVSSKIVCNMTEQDDGVIAIFAPQCLKASSAIIQSVATSLEIPYIQTNWQFNSNPEEDTVVNFYPDSSKFAQGLAVIIKHLHWKSFVVLYENDEGLIKLQEVLKLQNYDKNKNGNFVVLRKLGSGPDHRSLLKEIKNSTETHIVLDCETNHIIDILLQAKEMKLLEAYTSYFLTSLDSHTIDFSVLNTKANITTIRIIDPHEDHFKNTIRTWDLGLTSDTILTETVLMYDALNLFMESINSWYENNDPIKHSSLSCTGSEISLSGYNITSLLRIKVPTNLVLSGPLRFDAMGNRNDFNIYVVQAIKNNTIAIWSPNTPEFLNLTQTDTERYIKMLASFQDDIINVSSRIGEPYLRHRKPNEGEVLTGNDRYEGYSMDLIQGLSEILNFTFRFHLAEDGKYGNYDPKIQSWNGLIKDILEHKAQLAICDLTITHQRREVVDFSTPFMTLGISILHKKADEKDINMFAFLDPFSVEVWIYTATLYLTVSIILYFVARMAPGDWEKPHPCEQNPEELENIWDLKNCLWLTLGSIMTQGCDILPKGISSRMASSMWWFFSLIMTSSYTANLAAFLTMERMEPSIDSADALAKQVKIKYGTVSGGATQEFFRESNYSTFQRMWTNMISNRPSVFEKNNPDGVKRVQTTKHGLYAFLMESSQIEYVTETKCDLKQVGGLLDSKGYGVAMPLNFGLRFAINTAILQMQESGKLNQLKQKWWKEMRDEESCGETSFVDSASSELALANVGGVFLVLGIGVSMAFAIAIIEFLWNVRNVSVEEHITYCEAFKVELIFALQIWVTKKRTKVELSESSSSHSGDGKSLAHSILQGAGSLFHLNNLSKTGTLNSD